MPAWPDHSPSRAIRLDIGMHETRSDPPYETRSDPPYWSRRRGRLFSDHPVPPLGLVAICRRTRTPALLPYTTTLIINRQTTDRGVKECLGEGVMAAANGLAQTISPKQQCRPNRTKEVVR